MVQAMSVNTQHKFLSVSEAAELLDYTPQYVCALARGGRIDFIPSKLGRLFRREEVEALASRRHAKERITT